MLAEKFRKVFDAFIPPPKLSLVEWCEANITLSPATSAISGPYRVKQTPYLRGFFDAVDDPTIRKVVLMKGSQLGMSQCAINIVAFHIAHKPGPMMLIQPTLRMASDFSKDRLIPLLKDTPATRSKCDFSHLGGTSSLHIVFNGGTCAIAGANSPASLASKPAAIAIVDEVDRAPISIKKEGNPISLVARRLATYKNYKFILISTPTVKNFSNIEQEYKSSDQRRYFIPCPHCDHKQTLEWDNVKWTEGKPKSARYYCRECGAGWTDIQRWKSIDKGDWIATAPYNGTAGFQISELNSKFVALSKMVQEYEEAKAGGEETYRVWVNTCLGLPYSNDAEPVTIDDLLARKEDFNTASIPNNCRYMVATADVQDNRIEALVTAFGPDQEQYLIKHSVFYGSPDDPLVFEEFVKLYDDTYYKQDGSILKPAVALIDSRGHFTGAILHFANEQMRKRKKIFPIAGITGDKTALFARTPKTSDTYKGMKYYTVGVNTARDMIFERLKNTTPGKRYIHISDTISDDAVKQLRNEIPEVVKHGHKLKRIWKTLGPCELWDMTVYAVAALWVDYEAYKRACVDFIPPPVQTVRKSSYLERKKSEIYG